MIKSFSGQVVFCFISAYVGENWLSQYIVLSRRYALRWIYFYLNIFIFEIYTQQWYESDF